jgi:hypothetical protein
MRFNICSITNPGNYVFDELCIAAASGIRRLGHEALISRNQLIPFVTNIVVGAHQPIDLPPLPPGTIIWNTEQIVEGSTWLTDRYINILRTNPVWDYSHANIELLKNMGIQDIHYAGLGYSPDLEVITPKEKDIDVLFYGSFSERRAAVLQGLLDEGINLETLYGVYGKDRDDYIARSKIIINIHFFKECYFEPIRVGYLINNKCFVISERSTNKKDEDIMADSIVIAKYDDLIEACKYYLKNDAERIRIASEGYTKYKDLPQENILAPLFRNFGNVKVLTI